MSEDTYLIQKQQFDNTAAFGENIHEDSVVTWIARPLRLLGYNVIMFNLPAIVNFAPLLLPVFLDYVPPSE